MQSVLKMESMPNLKPSVNAESANERREAAFLVWQRAAWIAGLFSLVVGLVMIGGHFNREAIDPLKSPELKEYKQKLRLDPADEALKQKIRVLDLQLRQQYFRQLSQMGSGVYLLLGGTAAFILAVSQCARFRRPLPTPGTKTGNPSATRALAVARWSVAASGLAVGGVLFALTLGQGTALPKRMAEVDKLPGGEASPTAPNDAATAEELNRNWPRFRGPGGSGVAMFTNAPVSWNTTNGAGIAWRSKVPANGFNSPIVRGERVFFSGGDANQREVFCLDLKTGKLQWRQAVANVPGSPAQPPDIPESTGYAAPTMATDGRRVYVMFANGDVAAFSMEGKLVWSKGFGALKNPYGFASSLATWQDRLIVQLDQGESEEGKSRLYALDGRTGQVVWQRPRKVGSSWASPIVIEAAGKAQIIALSVPWVIAYAATDGTELWRVECLNGEVTPSPVFAGGLVYVPSPSEKLLAIRPDGQGDVTKTHVVWTNEDNVPDVTSPVSNGELLFALTTAGMLTCFDAKDGKKQWEHDLDMECHASPSLAGGRLYIFGQKGTAVIAEAGRQYKEIFRTEMGDAFHASPAFVQDRIVLRGGTNVWCLAGTMENKQ
jgi:outer membrane protein assembly factor BamB